MVLDNCYKANHDIERRWVSDRYSTRWAEVAFCWDCEKAECKIHNSCQKARNDKCGTT